MGVAKDVEAEHAKPTQVSRFPAGLPASRYMQLLFVQHLVHKMKNRKYNFQ